MKLVVEPGAQAAHFVTPVGVARHQARLGHSIFQIFADRLTFRQSAVVELQDRHLARRVAAQEVAALFPVTLFDQFDLVIDGCDNFPTRYLVNDASVFHKKPVVHGSIFRFDGQVTTFVPGAGPCYRCLFEDLPTGDAPDCASAGVVGPVCGVAGALAADRALRILAGDASAFGTISTYDGRRDLLRSVPVRARAACPLCGSARAILDLDGRRYLAVACAS